MDDALRAYSLGIRSVLVADEGFLVLAHALREKALWPFDLRIKVSVMLGSMNPIAIKHWADLGCTTYNVPTDLSVGELATVRSLCGSPLDIYVEAPDDVGGFVRYSDLGRFVRYVAPVYLKYGVRNAPNIYPSGRQWESQAIAMGQERVRRAHIGYEFLERENLTEAMRPLPVTSDDLAVPIFGDDGRP